ncbi:MAG TPA: hypothetical protein VJ954_03855 [Ignavibacteriaceae bacterium]|nr:hypothetical protein [Ignavibacteriaceae bacterium]
MKEEFNDMWDELKDAWRSSSRSEKIEFQISGLVAELKSKVSQFEKDSIKSDIKFIKSSMSQFERDSIKNDLTKIKASINNIIGYFKKKK